MLFRSDKLVDPSIRVREIYLDRIRAMRYFSRYEDFFLYGRGWDEQISGFGPEDQNAALKCWKGMIDIEYEAKLNCMRGFKFSICFENCNFPGYVTEKIFDAFLAGCIPVYYGAPDIKDFVPEGAFIDYTKFTGMEELDRFLQGLSEAEANNYLKAAADFIHSPAFDRFYVNNVVKKMVDLALKC